MNVFRYSFLHREFLVIPKVGKKQEIRGVFLGFGCNKDLKTKRIFAKKINRFEGILEKTKQ